MAPTTAGRDQLQRATRAARARVTVRAIAASSDNAQLLAVDFCLTIVSVIITSLFVTARVYDIPDLPTAIPVSVTSFRTSGGFWLTVCLTHNNDG